MSGRKPKWTRARINKIVAARKSGVSIAEIIARFKLSTATLYIFLRRGGAPIRKLKRVPPRDRPDSTVAPWIAAEIAKMERQARCVHDTDGDGDCHLCVRAGGCKHQGGGL